MRYEAIMISLLALCSVCWAEQGPSFSPWSASGAVSREMSPQELAKRVGPAVVQLMVVFPKDKMPADKLAELSAEEREAIPSKVVLESGSAFFVSTKKGVILVTNAHVVADLKMEPGGELHVNFGQDRFYIGMQRADDLIVRVVAEGVAGIRDFAILEVPQKDKNGRDWPTLPLGDNRSVSVGDEAYAFGYPLGGQLTLTKGVVGVKDWIKGGIESNPVNTFIQTDAAINPGNSGGPLVNARGEVIGVNTSIKSQSGMFSGMGFAATVDDLKRAIDQYVRTGDINTAVIGAILNTEENARYASVKGVLPGSPAEKAGLAAGDVIVKVDGVDLPEEPQLAVFELRSIVMRKYPGSNGISADTVQITFMRAGKQNTVWLTVAPQAASTPNVLHSKPELKPKPEPEKSHKLWQLPPPGFLNPNWDGGPLSQ